MFSYRDLLASFTIVILVVPAGCGRQNDMNLHPVTGIVKLDGKPLPNAFIRFEPMSPELGSHSVAVTDKSGRFQMKYTRSLAGAVTGKHQVRISTGNQGAVNEAGDPFPIPELLPAIYHSKSTLEYDVEKKTNYVEFDLKSKVPEKAAR